MITAASAPNHNTTFAVPKPPLFALGDLLTTRAAKAALDASQTTPLDLLQKHVTGNWFHMDEEDQVRNLAALHATGDNARRIISTFKLECGTPVAVVTARDRSNTTFMLISELLKVRQ